MDVSNTMCFFLIFFLYFVCGAVVSLHGLTRFVTGYSLWPIVHSPNVIGLLTLFTGIYMALSSVSTLISLSRKTYIAGVISLALFVIVAFLLSVIMVVSGIDYTVLKVDKVGSAELQIIEEQFSCCSWKGPISKNCISEVGKKLNQNCYTVVGKNVISMFGTDTFFATIFLAFTLFLIFVAFQNLKSEQNKLMHRRKRDE
ncbi:hypothetical protein EIN_169070 [Entamoeba invadens IP1]|uniref:Uncharacterized protein n=1 Tax=Entamoeba invadens IP1 TaxID=370355 RepID=A0A0A1TVM4_ENTIV|nr:hypothetical protein EIN_169070 [Entamoeba invadens IP1]ELP84492.1 hypothetical protein EIN_169070 [Entamoeba invadens IP1]|eukprot:XP_004183838.1 hypothetical protein EIN_169070 [Entamoeba invadens IP1]